MFRLKVLRFNDFVQLSSTKNMSSQYKTINKEKIIMMILALIIMIYIYIYIYIYKIRVSIISNSWKGCY